MSTVQMTDLTDDQVSLVYLDGVETEAGARRVAQIWCEERAEEDEIVNAVRVSGPAQTQWDRAGDWRSASYSCQTVLPQ